MTLPARSTLALLQDPAASARGGRPPPPLILESTDLADLFRRYAPYVATIGLKLLGRDDELDDLVQDVFIEAHRGLHQLRNLDAAKGWLARVTVRRAIRRLRRNKIRAFFSLDALPEHTSLVDTAATPEERAHVASTYRLLERIPVPQRIAWVLRHLEGETLDSIAEMCGCSKTTVQRRLRAAQRVIGKMEAHVTHE